MNDNHPFDVAWETGPALDGQKLAAAALLKPHVLRRYARMRTGIKTYSALQALAMLARFGDDVADDAGHAIGIVKIATGASRRRRDVADRYERVIGNRSVKSKTIAQMEARIDEHIALHPAAAWLAGIEQQGIETEPLRKASQ